MAERLKALDAEPSDGSEGPRIDPRQSQKLFIKSQVRVGLGILTDLNWHLPSNITIMINAPSQLKGETRMVYYYIQSWMKNIVK